MTSVTLACAGRAWFDWKSWEIKDAAGELLRGVFGLGDSVGAIEEKGDDFLEREFADVHGAVDAIAGFDPEDFPGGDVPRDGFGAVAEFDVEEIAAEDDRDAMVRIVVPGSGLARGETLAADE